ncbi:hypothetical protein GCM10011608_29240 [Micromonospora sonchi]|uniref:Uncharacterized protein n=1 Tax=Micromonospora sonchi TaxID=1763543 RepID=A0A917WZE2_9ACTN|nr:hypothetical protein [Micromonospora sonchi]GGM42717.1 hypothetical protein GCM10011608_29240 [Micromonospora sonchi]
MTSRAGEAFSTDRAIYDIEALLAVDLPAGGSAVREGDPETGEWTATRGDGFEIRPIWESEGLTGVYGRDWNEAEEAAAENLALVVRELDRRWGPHRPVSMRVPLFRARAGEPILPLFQSLCDVDCYGDLAVWEPVNPSGRWVGVSVNQCDGDAPMILTAVVSNRPIIELAD